MDVPSPDEKSVITYVSSIYDAFPKVPEGGEGISATVKEHCPKKPSGCAGFGWSVLIRLCFFSPQCVQSTFVQSRLNPVIFIHGCCPWSMRINVDSANSVASSIGYSRCLEIESHLESP